LKLVVPNRLAVSRVLVAVIVIVIIAVAGAGAYFALAKPTSSSTTTSSVGAPVYGGTLTADEEFEPSNIDPTSTNTEAGLAIDANVLDTLLAYNASTGQIQPSLATNYTVSPDGLMYTFNLRQGVYFVNPATNSTVDEFNATDVQYSWQRVLYMANGYVFGPPIDNMNISTFKIINPYEFSVNLTAAFSAFPATVADFYNAIIDKSVDVAHGGYSTNGTINSFMANNLVGTGPYMMSQWVKGDHITLTRNPYYWGHRPYLNQIIIDYKQDPSTRLLDIKSKSVQVANIDPNLLSQLQGTSGIVLKTLGLSDNIGPIGMDVQLFPTNNINVRLAIEHAINYSFIDNNIFDGYAVSFAGPIPQGMFGYNSSIPAYQQNVTLAKQEMSAAGFNIDSSGNLAYSNGTALAPINFVYPYDWPSASLVASAIQSDLANIGLQVNIIGDTSAAYSQTTSIPFNSTSHPQMLAYYWTPDFIDPADYASPIFDYNFATGYANTTIQSLYNQSIHTADSITRAHLYSEITVDTLEQAPVVWTFQTSGYAVYTSNVQGLIYNPLIDGYGYQWDTVWLS
jgi:peptide/nickel transport system substrate-binding protein